MTINNKDLTVVSDLVAGITTTEGEFQTGMRDVTTEIDAIQRTFFGTTTDPADYSAGAAVSLDAIRGLNADVVPGDLNIIGGIASTNNDGNAITTNQLKLLSQLNTGVSNTAVLSVLNGVATTLIGSELNFLDGVNATQTQTNEAGTSISATLVVSDIQKLAGWNGDYTDLDKLNNITASSAEINILDGVTGVNATEISYLSNVTSDLQTQLNSKLDLDDTVQGNGITLTEIASGNDAPQVTVSVNLDGASGNEAGLDLASSGLQHYTAALANETTTISETTANGKLITGVGVDAYGHAVRIDTNTISAGEGIDITFNNGNMTVLGEAATATNLGIASFDADDFDVANGAVSLDATTQTSNARGAISTNAGSGHPLSYASGTGVISHNTFTGFQNVNTGAGADGDVFLSSLSTDGFGHISAATTGTLSASAPLSVSSGAFTVANATTSAVGVASFNSTDFSVNNGAVTINDSSVRGSVSGSNGITYDSSSGQFSHTDDSTAVDVTQTNFTTNGDIVFVSGINVDDFGHVDTTPTTQTLTDGNNIVFTRTTDSSMALSVPTASTTVRGVVQPSTNDFNVSGAGVMTINSIGGSQIDDNSIGLGKLAQISGVGLIGTDGTGNTDAEVLTVENVRDLLDLQAGNGLSYDATDNTLNVTNLTFANNYVFATIALRNAGMLDGNAVEWHPGDIAITTTAPTEVWVYINPTNKTGAVVNSDFAEVTLDPTNLAVGSRSATGFSITSSTGTNAAVPSATQSLAGLMLATDKTKLDSVEANANNYSFNIEASGTSGTGTISDNETLSFTNSGAATVTRIGDTINVNSVNTTYGAGTGITLTGTVFSHTAPASPQSSVNNSGATVIQDVTLDTLGHITGLNSVTLTASSLGAAASGHTHGTFDRNVTDLSGATVFDDITVSDGIVTGIGTRNLTAANVGAAAASHNHNASNINAGTLDDARIPNLNASKITTGTLADARIPNLNASKTTTGVFNTGRLGTGTASATTYLRGDGTWAGIDAGSSVAVGTSLPSTASDGDLFFYCGAEEGDGARLYVRVNNNWVDAAPGTAGSGGGGSGGADLPLFTFNEQATSVGVAVNNTYTIPYTGTYRIILVGAGGTGYVSNTGGSFGAGIGAGGGAGFAMIHAMALDAGDTVAYSLAARVENSRAQDRPGSTAGNSSVSINGTQVLTANGGGGGSLGAGGGGAGGTATGGDFRLAGSDGNVGNRTAAGGTGGLGNIEGSIATYLGNLVGGNLGNGGVSTSNGSSTGHSASIGIQGSGMTN